MLNLFKPRSLGARIIAINFIGLMLLALGFIYVDKSDDNLVKARIEALLVQANLFAFSFDLDPEIREDFRENLNKFKVRKIKAPDHLCRSDLRLTVDNPEDLIICREVYNQFIDIAPKINLEEVIKFLDNNPELKKLTKNELTNSAG